MLCEQPGRNGTQTQQSSSRDVDAAATALLRFAGNVDTDRHGEPAVLGVITSAGYADRREDGVHVIPITAPSTVGPAETEWPTVTGRDWIRAELPRGWIGASWRVER